MTLVKDLIQKTMRLVGRADAAEVYGAAEPDAEHQLLVKNLLYCFNAVADELLRHYFPTNAKQAVSVTEGKFYFSSLSAPPLRLISVTDGNGNAVPYQLFPDHLELSADSVVIDYVALHAAKQENEQSGLDGRMGDKLIIYGMAAEYCLINGECGLAELWENRYRVELDRSMADLPASARIPPRRWV